MDEFDLILMGEDVKVIEEQKNLPELKGIEDAQIQNTYSEIKLQITDIEVNNDTAFHVAEFDKKAKRLKKFIDEKRKEIIQPMRNRIIEVEKPYKNLVMELDKLIKLLGEKNTKFLQEKRRIELERQEKERRQHIEDLETTKEGLDDELEIEIVEAKIEEAKNKELTIKPAVKSITATSYLKKYYKYEIVDEDAIPREYCDPSPSKLNRLAKTSKGKAELPGAKFYIEERAETR